MHTELTALLQRREAIIGDHSWRDRDSSGHLEALKQVSEEISAWATSHHTQLDPRLRHYLENASFQKALAHLRAIGEE